MSLFNLKKRKKKDSPNLGPKFAIEGWNGQTYYYTAKGLYERILADSKSDYNWLAPATELVRVCNRPHFSAEYGQAIKILILNCFANVELSQEEYWSIQKPTDAAAVYSCYNSLPNTNEKALEVKHKYLNAIITAVTKYTGDEVRFPIHIGPTYNTLCKNWKKAKFDEYASREYVDFIELRKALYADYDKMIKTAEEAGVFEEDDAKTRESMQKFWESLKFTVEDIDD